MHGPTWAVVSVTIREHDGRVYSHPPRDKEAQLLVAAPELARALLELLSETGHTLDCRRRSQGSCSSECDAAREALRKAGVLP